MLINNYFFHVFEKFIYICKSIISSSQANKFLRNIFWKNPKIKFNTLIKIIKLKQIRFAYYMKSFFFINFIIFFKEKFLSI